MHSPLVFLLTTAIDGHCHHARPAVAPALKQGQRRPVSEPGALPHAELVHPDDRVLVVSEGLWPHARDTMRPVPAAEALQSSGLGPEGGLTLPLG